jgi:hypothetical protein
MVRTASGNADAGDAEGAICDAIPVSRADPPSRAGCDGSVFGSAGAWKEGTPLSMLFFFDAPSAISA